MRAGRTMLAWMALGVWVLGWGCVERYDSSVEGDAKWGCHVLEDGEGEGVVGGVVCGEKWCQVGEHCLWGECYAWECGDGKCQDGESCELCPGDCGVECKSKGFVALEAGSFWMGSPAGLGELCPQGYMGGGCGGTGAGTTTAEVEWEDRADEPLHKVTLGHRFEVKATEVTQGEWKEAMGVWSGEGWNPSGHGGCGSLCPVERVSWFDALAYLNWMSERAGLAPCYELTDVYCKEGTTFVGDDAGKCMTEEMRGVGKAEVALRNTGAYHECEGYRLPTEAEWEYAARAGRAEAYGNGTELDAGHRECETPSALTRLAWYCGNDESGGPKKVGQLEGNLWGLFDMHGNVWEWCWDGWDSSPYSSTATVDPEGMSGETKRVVRGGSFSDKAKDVRAANRARAEQADYLMDVGFRPCRTLP